MVTFKTEKIISTNTPISTKITGHWRKRPKGRRLLTDQQIREIRVSIATNRHIANQYGISNVLAYYIKNRAIYKDVI